MSRSIRWWIAVLAVGAISAATHSAFAKSAAEPLEPREGEWRIGSKQNDGRVEFQLQRRWQEESGSGSWSHTDDIRPSALEGITPQQWNAADTPVSFLIEHDAGTFRADGRLKRGKGSGRFVFEPDADYQAELEQLGFRDLVLEDLERLCVHDVSLEWLHSFGSVKRAYSLDDLLRLRQHDISGDYVSEMKAAGVSDTGIEELVRLKINGIEPDYVRALTSDSRLRHATDDLVRLKVNGVTAAEIREVKSRQRNATVEDILRLKLQGEL